jgi:YebC/PmpR family DNA-binding regulatory protein
MSGHSKWATIKRKKGATDAKRGQAFTRLTRELAIAAREGGSDPEGNFRLRLVIERARAQNMPKDNIERAIKRGSGEGKEGETFDEVYYEGYGPGGVALLVDCITENRNRTVSELRHLLGRAGGNLADAGSVAWQFRRVAYFSMPTAKYDYDRIFEIALDSGAEDVTSDGDSIEITAPVEAFKEVADRLQEAGIEPEEAELRYVANQEIELPVDASLQALRTIEMIEDLDDVQDVYSNLRITDEALAAMESAA